MPSHKRDKATQKHRKHRVSFHEAATVLPIRRRWRIMIRITRSRKSGAAASWLWPMPTAFQLNSLSYGA